MKGSASLLGHEQTGVLGRCACSLSSWLPPGQHPRYDEGAMRLTVLECCEVVVLPGVQGVGRPRVPASHRRLVVDLSNSR
jgi:hypothetical protein